MSLLLAQQPVASSIVGTFLTVASAFTNASAPISPWLDDDYTQVPVANVVEEEPWVVSVTPSRLPLRSAFLSDEEVEITLVLSTDEGELRPQPTVIQWQSLIITDPNGDWATVVNLPIDEFEWQAPSRYTSPWHPTIVSEPSSELVTTVVPLASEEDSWIPLVPQTSVKTQILSGTSGPTSATVSLAEELEWLYIPKYASLWHPAIVSEPSSEIVPFIAPSGIVFENDYWLPPVLPVLTHIQILYSTSGPSSATAFGTTVEEEPQYIVLVPPTVIYAITQWSYSEDTTLFLALDDAYQPAVPKIASLWYPTIVSDPTDGVIPLATAIEEEPQLAALVPPPETYAVTPWSYGSEDIGNAPLLIIDEPWYNPTKPVPSFFDDRFANRYDTDIIVPPAAPLRIDEDCPAVYVSRPRGRTLLPLWAFEPEFSPDLTFCLFVSTVPDLVITAPTDPAFAQDSPIVPSFSVNTPTTPTLTPSTPVDPTFTGDVPANPRCDD